VKVITRSGLGNKDKEGVWELDHLPHSQKLRVPLSNGSWKTDSSWHNVAIQLLKLSLEMNWDEESVQGRK
jgi:hypothetical protein